ncbi:hypothetical protein JX580_10530 [Thiomicrospira microaerophila]|uniref:CCDC90 family protein n=1 Tax=Thiomicrospira microaerophila TaxID=406020 RepID=UPI00200D73E5|nr:CCDC90 family protein [Thiomicrospira microaerophila]UQB42080.1 hypothetical protein JX580_10530 [Thiomicrospira microaerophila]
MSAITFNTLKFVKTLKSSGMSEEQAEAIANAVRDAQEIQLVTKYDLQKELEPVRKELLLVKWMVGLVIAIQVIPLLQLLVK